jgi:hypothetical protein
MYQTGSRNRLVPNISRIFSAFNFFLDVILKKYFYAPSKNRKYCDVLGVLYSR